MTFTKSFFDYLFLVSRTCNLIFTVPNVLTLVCHERLIKFDKSANWQGKKQIFNFEVCCDATGHDIVDSIED
jgi:hypothetical protein